MTSVTKLPHHEVYFVQMAKSTKSTGAKTSIYLDPFVIEMLAAREGPVTKPRRHGERAGTIKRIIRRYDEICLRELPAGITDADWEAVVAAGRNTAGADDDDPMTEIIRTLMRAGTHEDLVHQLSELSTAQRFAVADFVERHRASELRGDTPPRPPKKSAAPLRRGA